MKRFYDRSVRHRTVQAGYLVLCIADVNLRERDKFAPGGTDPTECQVSSTLGLSGEHEWRTTS